jgi:hypothetical protein
MHKFHPKLHELISARAEELGVDMVLNERVKVRADGLLDNGSEFDVDLLSGGHLRADLVVRVFVTSRCSPYTSSAQDPCYRPYTYICTTTHTRTRVHHIRRLHLRAADSATRRHRISKCICDRRRRRYEEPKGGTPRSPACACSSREHCAPRDWEFRCCIVRILPGAMEDLYVTWLGESIVRLYGRRSRTERVRCRLGSCTLATL